MTLYLIGIGLLVVLDDHPGRGEVSDCRREVFGTPRRDRHIEALQGKPQRDGGPDAS